jgi:DNA-3-methyladenine glycosylase II
LFCLGHADAFPAGDLAVQEAARIALGLRSRPDAKALNKIAEAWRPWRGVAAHLMWGYYHVVKKREGIGVETRPAVDAKKHWPQIKKTKAVKKAKTATGKTAKAKQVKKAKGVRRAT